MEVIIIAKSTLFPTLTDISFADKDPDSITQQLLTLYENSSGRSLARGDPVRLFLDAIILEVILQRNLIDFSAKQNLLAYAQGNYLDHLGLLLGVTRLQAAHAVTTLRATLSDTLSHTFTIPEGTRVSAGSIIFATTQEVTLSPGTLTVDIPAQCSTAGVLGNDFAPGQINQLLDILPVEVDVQNITVSSGGSEIEPDEALRERIHIAPESFSVAGPVNAYKYFALSANPDIIDVAVVGPPDTNPGNVNIYPLMTDGTLPSNEVLQQVYDTCNASNVRPDTDYVHVLKPEVITYNLNITYWISEDDSVMAASLRTAIEQSISDWMLWQRKSLGRDINPSELIHRVVDSGAKRCVVSSPQFAALKDWQVAFCGSQSVSYAGLEKE